MPHASALTIPSNAYREHETRKTEHAGIRRGTIAGVGAAWVASEWARLRRTPALSPESERNGIRGEYRDAGFYRIFVVAPFRFGCEFGGRGRLPASGRDALTADIHALAHEMSWRVVGLVFCEPESFSFVCAAAYREWYAQHGIETRRLVVDSSF
jgi:hypothetical protein